MEYKKQKRKEHTLKKPNYTDPKFYETPEFMKLNKKWMAKLDKSKDKNGEKFEDIEDRESPNEYLKQWHDAKFAIRYSLPQLEETRDYYLAAANLLNTFTFKNGRDRKIWMMHSEGIPERHIARKLGITDWRVRKLILLLQPRIKRMDNK